MAGRSLTVKASVDVVTYGQMADVATRPSRYCRPRQARDAHLTHTRRVAVAGRGDRGQRDRTRASAVVEPTAPRATRVSPVRTRVAIRATYTVPQTPATNRFIPAYLRRRPPWQALRLRRLRGKEGKRDDDANRRGQTDLTGVTDSGLPSRSADYSAISASPDSTRSFQASTPASATSRSCETAPPETPIAPTTLPFFSRG